MGLGAGGKMRQEIYADKHDFDGWDTEQTNRCFVHICNAPEWRDCRGRRVAERFGSCSLGSNPLHVIRSGRKMTPRDEKSGVAARLKTMTTAVASE